MTRCVTRFESHTPISLSPEDRRVIIRPLGPWTRTADHPAYPAGRGRHATHRAVRHEDGTIERTRL